MLKLTFLQVAAFEDETWLLVGDVSHQMPRLTAVCAGHRKVDGQKQNTFVIPNQKKKARKKFSSTALLLASSSLRAALS